MGAAGSVQFRRMKAVVSSKTKKDTGLVPIIRVGDRLSHVEGMDSTPKSMLKYEYKYFCPICMFYFRAMLEAGCCGHYMCYGCSLEYILSHDCRELCNSANPAKCRVRCPSCNVQGLSLTAVREGAPVRSYEDDGDGSDGKLRSSLRSPVKIGDTVEALQRKLLTFEATCHSKRNVSNRAARSDAHAFAVSFIAPILAQEGRRHDNVGQVASTTV